ncbi:hypothetical protein [Azospirillum doebereinerae]|uniref:Uncharacterized protein n=1 Tax=Azospirillum doebereinerae TaxID=92933 RepID=A0A3S0WQC8_9PROT|nr:hypothetical protein [Azospirillum doebereinerae]RUQ61240.1 hypothetical protein EJ913_30010 [Azospirillum doebereinerae]
MSEALNVLVARTLTSQQAEIDRLQQRVTNLLNANNTEVERRRSAEFQVGKLTSLLRDYEAWEADLVLNADWSNETPRLTQPQLDRLLRLQAARNMALRPALVAMTAKEISRG